MVSYVGENYPTSYEQVGRYVSSEKLNFTPVMQILLHFRCTLSTVCSACISHMISACTLEQLH